MIEGGESEEERQIIERDWRQHREDRSWVKEQG
jgi:hypothetical protein